jgi:hypothetical protein
MKDEDLTNGLALDEGTIDTCARLVLQEMSFSGTSLSPTVPAFKCWTGCQVQHQEPRDNNNLMLLRIDARLIVLRHQKRDHWVETAAGRY